MSNTNNKKYYPTHYQSMQNIEVYYYKKQHRFGHMLDEGQRTETLLFRVIINFYV